jgi:hypothetical protein
VVRVFECLNFGEAGLNMTIQSNLLPGPARMKIDKEQGPNRRAGKLTEEIAAEIRRGDYILPTDLARIYGVPRGCVISILRNEIWASFLSRPFLERIFCRNS